MALQDYLTLVFHSGDREATQSTWERTCSRGMRQPGCKPVKRIADLWMEGSKHLMAKVIEFYIPNRFQKKVAWVPTQKRGQVIEFCPLVKKSA
jgi:hypothetical protein